MAINSYDTTISIPAAQARNLYGVTAEDLKTLDADGNGKITAKELKTFGLDKNSGLTNYFNAKTSGALTAKTNGTTTNPFSGSLKDSFRTNYNQGQLSPRVNSDLAQSPVGNVLPMLYA